jgi:hypothetical protein
LLSEKAIADDRMRARWRNASANPQYTSYMKLKAEVSPIATVRSVWHVICSVNMIELLAAGRERDR